MTWADAVDLFIKASGFLLSLVAMAVAIVRTRKSEVERRFEAGSEKLKEHERRVAKLEHAVEHLPSRSEVHELERLIAELNANMVASRERMSAMSSSVTRIETYLLEKKG